MSVFDWLKKDDIVGEPSPPARRYVPLTNKAPEAEPLSLPEAIAAGFPDLSPAEVVLPIAARLPESAAIRPTFQEVEVPDAVAASVSEPQVDKEELEDRAIAALRTVFDPEIPVNIYDLGLIYGLSLDLEKQHIDIQMTLTAPGCPVAQTFPGEVERRMTEVPGIDSAKVELVWEPPWTRDRMSEAALLTLGML